MKRNWTALALLAGLTACSSGGGDATPASSEAPVNEGAKTDAPAPAPKPTGTPITALNARTIALEILSSYRYLPAAKSAATDAGDELGFVLQSRRACGEGGFVEDGLQAPDSVAGRPLATWMTLHDLGGVQRESVSSIWTKTMDETNSAKQRDHVIQRLPETGRAPVVIMSDLSRAMDRELGSVTVPEVLANASSSDFLKTTPRALVESMHGLLRDRHGASYGLIAIGADPRTLESTRSIATYTLNAMPGWLDQNGAPRMRYVFCSAQRLTESSRERLEEIRDRLPRDAVLLVIDLCDDLNSDAAYSARRLAIRGPALPVAYWRPH